MTLFDLIRLYRKRDGMSFRDALDRARVTLDWQYEFDRETECWRWMTPAERARVSKHGREEAAK